MTYVPIRRGLRGAGSRQSDQVLAGRRGAGRGHGAGGVAVAAESGETVRTLERKELQLITYKQSEQQKKSVNGGLLTRLLQQLADPVLVRGQLAHILHGGSRNYSSRTLC